MKKIFRILFFSATAIFFTSLWNKGFIIENNFLTYFKASLAVGGVYYFLFPLLKLIFLPLNILTLGLFSTVFYSLILYFILNKYQIITIKSWYFPGYSFFGIIFSPVNISELLNIFLVAFSLSIIINLLEKIL